MTAEDKINEIREMLDKLKDYSTMNEGDKLIEVVTLFEGLFEAKYNSPNIAADMPDGVAYEALCALWAVEQCVRRTLEGVDNSADLMKVALSV